MKTGPASSAFSNIVAISAIKGQRNEQAHTQTVPSPRSAPVSQPQAPIARQPAAPLYDGPSVAPGQLLYAQLAGQSDTSQANTHHQGVAAYPSLPSAYQIISPTAPLSQFVSAPSGETLFDFEI